MLADMDADERDICIYLKGFRGQFVSLAQITRRAGGKKRYRDDPYWAAPVLSRLVEKKIVEADSTGHYRLKPPPTDKRKKWMSPQVRRILERSGKFNTVLDKEAADDLPSP